MRVLISGAGIAGCTLAYWLQHYGITPTIVEKAPELRTAGYMIDFWGAGFDIADRMGLSEELRRKGYIVQEVKVVDRNGKRVAGFRAADVITATTGGRYVSLPRGELAASIFGQIRCKVETIFGDSIAGIEQTDNTVHVSFDHGITRNFDLVVGADGLHSRVRELVFGDESRFEKYLGYKVAAFETDGYRPRDELAYVMYTEVHQQVGRFAMKDDRTLFLFTFADDEADRISPSDTEAVKRILHKRFGASGWECPKILDALDACDDVYFDRVSQIRMHENEGLWSWQRVTLIGDAASCVSLLAGQGCALAMIAAYILAGELGRADGNYSQAFKRYQDLFGPFVAGKQKAALRLGGSFAPKSKTSLFLRNQIMNLLKIPWVAKLAIGAGLRDKLTLPEY